MFSEKRSVCIASLENAYFVTILRHFSNKERLTARSLIVKVLLSEVMMGYLKRTIIHYFTTSYTNNAPDKHLKITVMI